MESLHSGYNSKDTRQVNKFLLAKEGLNERYDAIKFCLFTYSLFRNIFRILNTSLIRDSRLFDPAECGCSKRHEMYMIYSIQLFRISLLSCVHAPPENNEDEDRKVKDPVDMYKWDNSLGSSRSRWASSFKFHRTSSSMPQSRTSSISFFAGGRNEANVLLFPASFVSAIGRAIERFLIEKSCDILARS